MARLIFPQIFRKITAPRTKLTSSRGLQPRVGGAFLRGRLPSWRLVLAILIVSLLLLNLIRLGQNLYSNYQEAQAKQAQKKAIEAEITKWQEVVKARPNYRDAYFELAVLSYRLDRIQEAKQYLAKVFDLDPNFEPARRLERTISVGR